METLKLLFNIASWLGFVAFCFFAWIGAYGLFGMWRSHMMLWRAKREWLRRQREPKEFTDSLDKDEDER
jgi:hypothetical protein